jgi:hypothetical protein
MKRAWLIACLSLLLAASAGAADYDSLRLINLTNWGKYFNDLTGYLGESGGELRFSPVDAGLLARTLPKGISFKIKSYKPAKNDPGFQPGQIQTLSEKIISVPETARLFGGQSTEVVVYPSLNQLFILVNGSPYAKVNLQAGPSEEYLPVKDKIPARPTEGGDFKLSGSAGQYLSGTYYNESVVPFGAWIVRVDNGWLYLVGQSWFRLPAAIADDLARPVGQRHYTYYDVSGDGRAVRWGSNPYGRDILFWTKTGGSGYPRLGYAPGEVVYEQAMLIKDIVYLLTVDCPDDFASCVAGNGDWARFAAAGWQTDDARLLKAVGEFEDNRLPRSRPARLEALGLYHYYRQNKLSADQQKYWFDKVKRDWEFYKELRQKLRNDFNSMGVLSLENRQNLLETWINQRLAYEQVVPPSEAKFVQNLTFTSFFRPQEQAAVFNEREKAVMLDFIRRAASGEATGLSLQSVDALNNYNFGEILNDVLGNLYRSHGCMHVSPRHAYLLYELLPLNARITIKKYSDPTSPEAYPGLPLLATLVNFSDDLDKLKEQFLVTSEVEISVYPASGFWVINLDGKPFTQLAVKGGPQTAMNVVTSRDSKGRPVFENVQAYPTTPGLYRIFKKQTDYLSNIYYDLTIVPMGGLIEPSGGGWRFHDKNGQWRPLPDALSADLNRPPEARTLAFYDEVRNASGEVVSVKWGDNPFGKYSLEMTLNGKTPSPELIHSSGDLIMEERQLINGLITVMSAPYDELDDCVGNCPDFELYRTCAEFIADPSKGELLLPLEKASYRLHYGLSLTSAEAALLPPDALAAEKALRHQPLSSAELKSLSGIGAASKIKGQWVFNWPKLQGISFDTYQYAVTIEKYANHYAVLKRYWPELSGLRRAILNDFNNFVIKDPALFNDFMRELMLARTRLEKLSQDKAIKQLSEMVGD